MRAVFMAGLSRERRQESVHELEERPVRRLFGEVVGERACDSGIVLENLLERVRHCQHKVGLLGRQDAEAVGGVHVALHAPHHAGEPLASCRRGLRGVALHLNPEA